MDLWICNPLILDLTEPIDGMMVLLMRKSGPGEQLYCLARSLQYSKLLSFDYLLPRIVLRNFN